MLKKALQAAVRLGDKDAARRLKIMSTNAMWAWIATLAAALLGCLIVAVMWWSISTNAEEQTTARQSAKSQAEWQFKAAVDAAALRMKWVTSCRVTPAEAEKLAP